MTPRTFWENLESESLSQILKDQSGEEGTLVCLQTQKQEFKNLKTSVQYLKKNVRIQVVAVNQVKRYLDVFTNPIARI